MKPKKEAPPPLPTPDFENQVAAFNTAFFEFVGLVDPDFPAEIIKKNPEPPVPMPPTPDLSNVFVPAIKEDLSLPLRLSGPRVIETDIFGGEVFLENEVRVKGNVIGRLDVQIGHSCVIEGSVIARRGVTIAENSRIEGQVVAEDVTITGPVFVEGAIFSRGSITSTGNLHAEALFAANHVTLAGDAARHEVKFDTAIILAQTGNIEITVPVVMEGVKVNPKKQLFYIASDGKGDLNLISARGFTGPAEHLPEILTTLTDNELETELEGLSTALRATNPRQSK